MIQWQYKTICYHPRATGILSSVRGWADAVGKEYGPWEKGQNDWAHFLRQTEEALRLLDAEGWEFVSLSGMGLASSVAVFRKPRS